MVTEYQSNQLKVMAQTGSYDLLGGAATGSSHSRRLTLMDLCSLRLQGEPTRRNHVCSNQAHVEKSFRRDGPFDYEKYRHTRVDGNKRKIDKIFVREKDISFMLTTQKVSTKPG